MVAERELRPRADGALHARRRPRLHRARRPRAGPRADWLRERLATRPGSRQLPLRARPARRRTQGRLRQDAAASTGEDAVRLCLDHPKHPSFFVDKLWQLLRARGSGCTHPPLARAPLPRATFEIRPVVEAILRHPTLYLGPRMVKPPVGVHRRAAAGARAAESTRTPGSGSPTGAGQRLFMPPNVSGWDDERWLDTAHVPRALGDRELRDSSVFASTDKQAESLPAVPNALVEERARVLGPARTSGPRRRQRCLRFATRAMGDADEPTGRRRATAL